MSFIIAQIIVYVLFAYNAYGRVCDGNGTDTLMNGVEYIIQNTFDVGEPGIVHVNDNGIVDGETSTNESITKFLVSSMNDTDTDATEDDDGDAEEEEESVNTGAKISEDDDVIQATPNDPINERKTHMNIGFGEIQMIRHDREATQQRLIETLLYMYNNYSTSNVGQQQQQQKVPVECKMNHEFCAYWAARGECEARPGYMRINCAPTCFSCEDIVFEHRCPMPNTTAVIELNAWQPGDLNRMFERIVALYDNGSVVTTNNATTDGEYNNSRNSSSLIILSHPGMEVNDGVSAPWVVQIEDFLTSEECDTLIQLGSQLGYQRSTGLNLTQNEDGSYGNIVEDVRTSSNTWCLEECFHHPTTQTILQRIEYITNIPDIHSEYLQLLHYDVGQFYKIHHDYIDFHMNRIQGVRLATVFLYLNDVEEGGGTNFPELNVTVEAKRGRALIWPSVLDREPDNLDPLTKHQALPVLKGVKYGANSWIHQRDFKTPFEIGCTG